MPSNLENDPPDMPLRLKALFGSGYSLGAMKPQGTYKLRYRHAPRPAASEPALQTVDAEPMLGADQLLSRLARSDYRTSRILASLRNEILEGAGGCNLRIRQVFESPREVYRLELELPEFGYQRTTFLEREALEELLEADGVREVVETAALGD